MLECRQKENSRAELLGAEEGFNHCAESLQWYTAEGPIELYLVTGSCEDRRAAEGQTLRECQLLKSGGCGSEQEVVFD